MKSQNALLDAWEKALGQAGSRLAIIMRTGEMVQTFAQTEDRARQLGRELGRFKAGSVVAVQIGNHSDWPAIFIACLRQELVVLPLEQSISDRQRDSIFRTCNVAATAVPVGSEIQILPAETPAPATDWGEHPP